MSQLDAVRRAAEMTAAACADVIGQLVDADGSFTGLEVDDTPVSRWEALSFPLVCVRIKIVSGIDGEYLFALVPDQARIVAGAMGIGEAGTEPELTEIELSAVGEAMNQMMATAAAAMAEALSLSTEIGAPTVEVIGTRDEAEQVGDARYTAQFTIAAGELSATIVQVVSAELGAILEAAFAPSETGVEEAAEAPADLSDSTLVAVQHAARIAATSSAEVLTTLIGEHVTASAPEVEAEPADPLGGLTYPRVLVEIAHVAGLTGSSVFVLAPADSATLAAVMMGLDEPMGDGLSDLELSAVAEAMSQVMGGAANVLADTVGIEIAISPPVCTVAPDADAARAALADSAYCARFQVVSDRITADVLQLVPSDLAVQLDAAFAAGGGTAGGAPSTRPAGTSAAIASTNSAAARVVPGLLGFDSLRDVQVRVSAELGRARVPVSDVMNLPPGAIVELDRTPSETIDILVNGRAFARARLVLVDGEYAAQIVSLEPPTLMAG